MKYFKSSPSLPNTKVFGLAGVSLREAINAGTISCLPLSTAELAPPVTAHVLVAKIESVAKNTTNTEAKCPMPSFEFFKVGITLEAT